MTIGCTMLPWRRPWSARWERWSSPSVAAAVRARFVWWLKASRTITSRTPRWPCRPAATYSSSTTVVRVRSMSSHGRQPQKGSEVFGYRVPAPNEALLISGRKQRGADALPFKIVTGHGVFVAPIFSKATRLTLAMQEAEVIEDCFTQQGLTLAVQAVIAFKVGDDHESIAAAARRFQGDQSQMSIPAGRTFTGHPATNT